MLPQLEHYVSLFPSPLSLGHNFIENNNYKNYNTYNVLRHWFLKQAQMRYGSRFFIMKYYKKDSYYMV